LSSWLTILAKTFCSSKTLGASVAGSTTGTATATTYKIKIKTDLRHYPTFDGCPEKWTMFKRKFLAVAVMYGHGKILKKGWMVPSNAADAKLHVEHGNIIFSALILGLAAGTAILKVVKHDSTRDGAQAWADLVKWYKGEGSMEAIAKRAMDKRYSWPKARDMELKASSPALSRLPKTL
jgi:hypothetical protein